MKKIKWGIISTGRIANEFTSDFKYVENGEVIAVASRSQEKARTFAEVHNLAKAYGSYEDLYQDEEIDAVYVATPHNFHAENTIKALENGKGVLCEKPITVNPAEFDKVWQVAKSSGVYLMEGMWTYFLPAIRKTKEWVDSGQIGEIAHIKANFGFSAPFDPEGRLFNPDLAGGSLLDVGIYPIALSWLFLQSDPEITDIQASKANTGVDDDVLMTLKYGKVMATLHSSIKYKLHNHAFIIGDEGYIQIPDFWKADECYLYKGKDDELVEHFEDSKAGIGFNYEVTAMNEELINGKTESGTMPLSYSARLQAHMAAVMKQF